MSSKRKSSDAKVVTKEREKKHKPERMFVRWLETSGGKGRWAVYVRVEGNGETLAKIRRVLALDPDMLTGDFYFELKEEIPESAVDILCRYASLGDCTYTYEHSKYDALLPEVSTLPDDCEELTNRMFRNGRFNAEHLKAYNSEAESESYNE